MILNPINQVKPINFLNHYPAVRADLESDSCGFENPRINKKPLVERKIIAQNENINTFFDKISSQIFSNNKEKEELSNLLKKGFVTLSSSCYLDIKNPSSALGIELDPKNVDLSYFDDFIDNAKGVGINFSNFSNPIEEIIKINKYFKQKEPFAIRPPAGIALLNINHPKIEEFIQLKNNADYNDWCFDLSVVIDDEFFNNRNEKVYNCLLDSMLKKGEPGIIFSNNKNYICDCCAAAELKPNEGLTLAQINLAKFYNYKKNSVDYKYLKKTLKILKKALNNIDKNAYIGVLGYQDLLYKLNFEYGSKNALGVLDKILKVAKSLNCKMAFSPNGTTSRVLGVFPSIEPREKDIDKELLTLKTAQKYLDGQISKTIILDNNSTTKDVDRIIKTAKNYGLKGISVFKDEKKT